MSSGECLSSFTIAGIWDQLSCNSQAIVLPLSTPLLAAVMAHFSKPSSFCSYPFRRLLFFSMYLLRCGTQSLNTELKFGAWYVLDIFLFCRAQNEVSRALAAGSTDLNEILACQTHRSFSYQLHMHPHLLPIPNNSKWWLTFIKCCQCIRHYMICIY